MKSQSPFGFGGCSDDPEWAEYYRLSAAASQSPFGFGGCSDSDQPVVSHPKDLTAVSIAFRLRGLFGPAKAQAADATTWHGSLNRLSASGAVRTPQLFDNLV